MVLINVMDNIDGYCRTGSEFYPLDRMNIDNNSKHYLAPFKKIIIFQ